MKLNLDYLLEMLWEYLALTCIYTKKRGRELGGVWPKKQAESSSLEGCQALRIAQWRIAQCLWRSSSCTDHSFSPISELALPSALGCWRPELSLYSKECHFLGLLVLRMPPVGGGGGGLWARGHPVVPHGLQ